MTEILMFDAAAPPADAAEVSKYQVAAGYIGGDTPHVWTKAEWDRFAHMRRLPIFTRSDPAGHSGTADAFAALGQLYAIGAPKGIPVAWDMEAAVAEAYLNEVDAVMTWAGFLVWVYGEESTVFGNPECHGYWAAKWTGDPFMANHSSIRATQYEEGLGWDSSLVKEWQYDFRLWK
jgi:hypothetical protein